jgi:branched-chain amino acid transport system ATP-binding protein
MRGRAGEPRASTPPDLLLEAVGLAAGYHGHAVIEAVDLELRPGEVVALLGPNGAGKTTTLRALAGHLAPLSGQVRLNGLRATEPPHVRARRGLSYITEERSVFSQLTGAENLTVGRCDKRAVTELFPELQPALGRLGGQLSGGEQQMLTLGRALARHPTVLLADELSLGLAPLIVKRLLHALRSASDERGLGVLIVEQHVKHALAVADRIYVMRRGRIVLSGAAADVEPELQDAYLTGAGGAGGAGAAGETAERTNGGRASWPTEP